MAISCFVMLDSIKYCCKSDFAIMNYWIIVNTNVTDFPKFVFIDKSNVCPLAEKPFYPSAHDRLFLRKMCHWKAVKNHNNRRLKRCNSILSQFAWSTGPTPLDRLRNVWNRTSSVFTHASPTRVLCSWIYNNINTRLFFLLGSDEREKRTHQLMSRHDKALALARKWINRA